MAESKCEKKGFDELWNTTVRRVIGSALSGPVRCPLHCPSLSLNVLHSAAACMVVQYRLWRRDSQPEQAARICVLPPKAPRMSRRTLDLNENLYDYILANS